MELYGVVWRSMEKYGEVWSSMEYLVAASKIKTKERKQMQSSVCGRVQWKGFEKTTLIFRKN